MSSVVCPVDLDTQRLAREVAEMYSRVARDPAGEFHFHRGPRYAAEWLGYDPSELAALPTRATESFAGVANPLAALAEAPLAPGETVADIGSGAGMDLLLAAGRVGDRGRAIGVDSTPDMIEKCLCAAREAGYEHVEVRAGDLHELPLEDASVDAIISNGVLNLASDKLKAFGELYRALKPGGRLALGDIVVASELSDNIRKNYELWAA